MTDCAWNNPLEYKGEAEATPIKECVYPKCEECRKYIAGYCTVPMVVNKLQWLSMTKLLESYQKRLSSLESDVFLLMLHNPDAMRESL